MQYRRLLLFCLVTAACDLAPAPLVEDSTSGPESADDQPPILGDPLAAVAPSDSDTATSPQPDPGTAQNAEEAAVRLELYPAGSPMLMRADHENGDWVEYFGRRNSQGVPALIDMAVHHGADGVETVMSVDELGRFSLISNSEGLYGTVTWTDTANGELNLLIPGEAPQVIPVSLPAESAESLARRKSLAAAKTITGRMLGIDDTYSIDFEVVVEDCDGQPRTDLDGKVYVAFELGGVVYKAPARRNFGSEEYVFFLDRPATPGEAAQDLCEEIYDQQELLAFWCLGVGWAGTYIPHPAAKVPAMVSSPFCLAATEDVLSPSIADVPWATSLVCSTMGLAGEVQDVFSYGLNDLEGVAWPVVELDDCAQETREAEKQVFRLDSDRVTMRVDGCNRSPNVYSAAVGTDAGQIVANAEKWLVFRNKPIGGPFMEELPGASGAILPQWSTKDVCHWPGEWDPVLRITTEESGYSSLQIDSRPYSRTEPEFTGSLTANLQIGRGQTQVRPPTEAESRRLETGREPGCATSNKNSSINLWAMNWINISRGQVLKVTAKTPVNSLSGDGYRVSGEVILASPVIGSQGPFLKFCRGAGGAGVEACAADGPEEITFELTYEEARTLLKHTLPFGSPPEFAFPLPEGMPELPAVMPSLAEVWDAAFRNCIPIIMSFRFEAETAIEDLGYGNGWVSFEWTLDLVPSVQP